jgi:alpha-D-glucose phosphate-specific phosphoglucomutase
MSDKIRKQIKFGTDGWRGVISDNFTFENLGIVAQAISEWIKKDIKKTKGQAKSLAVGYDTRFLSKEYAQHVSRILAKNNIQVFLSDRPIPTPSLSYGVIERKCNAGIMITASHNPAPFNGIKIKTHLGGGAGVEITNKVESYLGRHKVRIMDLQKALQSGRIQIHNYNAAYMKFMRQYLDMPKVRQSKFKILTDVMHGSGGTLMAQVVGKANLKVSLMREDINPSFDGAKPEPVEEYVNGILKRLKKEDFDIGLILDGDGDRIAAVAPGGEYINPQRILALLTVHLVKNKGRKGGAVKTTCGSKIMDHICKKYGMDLYETPVGFKYISDLMISKNIVAGGEEAGGIGVQDYIPERDGTLAGLLLVEMMAYEKKDIKQILKGVEKEFGRYYYQRSDLPVTVNKAVMRKFGNLKTLLGKKVVAKMDHDGIRLTCEDESWLMLRPSGTEPLVRAYSESKSKKRSIELIGFGKKFLKRNQ